MWSGGGGDRRLLYNAGPALTDPEVVQPLAHGAALVGDLLEVLVEARLQRDEPGQWREVVFCGTERGDTRRSAWSGRVCLSAGGGTTRREPGRQRHTHTHLP